MAYNNVKVKARQTVAQSQQTKDLGTVSEVPMGDWNVGTPYKKLNLVRYNGATYIATQDNQGAIPTGSGIWLLVNQDGRGIQSTEITYQTSVSGTTPPTGEWVSDVPTVPQGQYMWTRVIYTFTDGPQTVAYSVSLQGLNFTQQDRDKIDRINEAIPSTASADNPLATHDFVNSSLNAMAAFYITYTQGDETKSGQAFPTHASLVNATTFYSGGQVRIPTQNDYATVLSDESQTQNTDGTYPTTRYVYQGGTYPNGQWELSFIVNSTTFTQAQLYALNSGISEQKIAQMETATAAKYTKPSSGIPESDLSDAVRTKLNQEGAVYSVNGQTGVVTITPANIGAVNKSGDEMSGSLILPKLLGTGSTDARGVIPVKYIRRQDIGVGANDSVDAYLQAWIKKVCELYPNEAGCIFIGSGNPASQMMIEAFIYETNIVDVDGMPAYVIGIARQFANNILQFNVNNHSYSSSKVLSTGNDIFIEKSSGTVDVAVKRIDTGNGVALSVGSSGVNRGIWDYASSKWMMYANANHVYLNPPSSSGKVYINGVNPLTRKAWTYNTKATKTSTGGMIEGTAYNFSGIFGIGGVPPQALGGLVKCSNVFGYIINQTTFISLKTVQATINAGDAINMYGFEVGE